MSPSPACHLGAGKDPSRPSEKPSRPSRKLPRSNCSTAHHALNHMKLNSWRKEKTANIIAASGDLQPRPGIAVLIMWLVLASAIQLKEYHSPISYCVIRVQKVSGSRASSAPVSHVQAPPISGPSLSCLFACKSIRSTLSSQSSPFPVLFQVHQILEMENSPTVSINLHLFTVPAEHFFREPAWRITASDSSSSVIYLVFASHVNLREPIPIYCCTLAQHKSLHHIGEAFNSFQHDIMPRQTPTTTSVVAGCEQSPRN
jgi:hypothetical protein